MVSTVCVRHSKDAARNNQIVIYLVNKIAARVKDGYLSIYIMMSVLRMWRFSERGEAGKIFAKDVEFKIDHSAWADVAEIRVVVGVRNDSHLELAFQFLCV